MNLKETIQKCLNENGIIVSDEGKFEEVNSINFISTIISLEQELEIEFPDEYLLMDIMRSFEHLYEIVESVVMNEAREQNNSIYSEGVKK